MKFQRHFLLIPIAGIVMFYLFWMFRSAPWNAMRWTAAILMVASFILFSIAHVQLGSSFSVSAQARTSSPRAFTRAFAIPSTFSAGC